MLYTIRDKLFCHLYLVYFEFLFTTKWLMRECILRVYKGKVKYYHIILVMSSRKIVKIYKIYTTKVA